MVDVVNRLFLKRSSFKSVEDLYNEIYRQIGILLNNGYAVSTYRSIADENIYIIEYASTDPSITDIFVLPVWLTTHEAKMIDDMRAERLLDKNTKDVFDWNDTNGGSHGQA